MAAQQPLGRRAVCLVLQGEYDSDPRVRRKAEALVSAGYDVDVLALCGPCGERRYYLNGVRVETLRLGKRRGSLARYGFEYAAFLVWAFTRVHLLTWRRRYAVIDVNTLPDFLVFAALFTRSMGARVVLDMHEITPEFYMSKYGCGADAVAVRVLTWLERVSFNFADRVLTINEPILNLLVARGLDRRKATIITNAADEERFATRPAPACVSHRGAASFVMIYHGTLTRIYGLDIAVDAFGLVARDMPGAELWILGSGPEQAALTRQVCRIGLESRVKVIGRVSAEEIPSWLCQADAGILPIRSDVFLEYAFPNKLGEFIITGKPVIVSRLRAIAHYFSEDALAFVKPESVADMARQMVRLYRDADIRRRLALRASEEYAPIRWEAMKQRYLTVVGALARPRESRVGSQTSD